MGNIAKNMNNYKKQLLSILEIPEECNNSNNEEKEKIIDWGQVTDIFGDGSCVAYFPFNNSYEDMLGVSEAEGFNGVEFVTEEDNNVYAKGGAEYNTHIKVYSLPINIFTSTNVAFSFFGKVFEAGKSAYFICSGSKPDLSGSPSVFIKSDYIGQYAMHALSFDRNYNDGNVHFFVFTVSDGVLKVYVDNVLSVSDNRKSIHIDVSYTYPSLNIYSLLQNQYISHYGGNRSFAQISRFRVFNRGLTEDEVNELYLKEKGEF